MPTFKVIECVPVVKWVYYQHEIEAPDLESAKRSVDCFEEAEGGDELFDSEDNYGPAGFAVVEGDDRTAAENLALARSEERRAELDSDSWFAIGRK